MTLKTFDQPPSAKFADRLGKMIHDLLDQKGWRFGCEGEDFSSEEISAPDGLLPMWMHYAQGLMEKAYAHQRPSMEYRVDQNGLCGVRPDPQLNTASLAVWALFLVEAFEDWRRKHPNEMKQNLAVPMDALYAQWREDLKARKMKLLAPKPAATPQMQPQAAGVSGASER